MKNNKSDSNAGGKIVVLHVLDNLDYGGIQSFLLNIYKNINRERIRFDFLLTYRGVYDEEFKKLGSNIYYIPNIKDVGYLKYVKSLRGFLRKHRNYSNIHIHYSQLTGLVSMIARRQGAKNIISHSHSASMQSKGKTALVKKIFQLGVGLFPNYYMACSKEAAKFLFHGKANKAMILKNGVDLKQYKYDDKERIIIRKELGYEKGDIAIGHIGRMDAVKNQAFLIEILQELNKKNNNYRLLLIGDGSEKKKLEKLVKKSGVNERITFLGNKKDSDRYYNAMDTFVFPSKSEGLGIALIEAQANGLKCFASTVVPRDANATNTVTFISLEKPATDWARIINEAASGRFNGRELIIKNGYDISDSAKRLQDFYESINRLGGEE